MCKCDWWVAIGRYKRRTLEWIWEYAYPACVPFDCSSIIYYLCLPDFTSVWLIHAHMITILTNLMIWKTQFLFRSVLQTCFVCFTCCWVAQRCDVLWIVFFVLYDTRWTRDGRAPNFIREVSKQQQRQVFFPR